MNPAQKVSPLGRTPQGFSAQAWLHTSRSSEARWPVSPCPAYSCSRSLKGHFLIGSALTYILSSLNRSVPLPLPSHPPTHRHTEQNSLLQSRRQEKGIYFWQAPRGGLRGLVTYSPPRISHPNKPCLSSPCPPWSSDHPACSVGYRMLSCLGFPRLGPPYPHPLSSQWL